MREDDDAPDDGTAQGSLADGLGETAGDEQTSAGDPYGDDGFDDGGYGDGDTDADTDADTGVDTTDPVDEADEGGGEPDTSELPDPGADDLDVALDDPLSQDVSPLEGVGFLLDELRDAVFGEDDGGGSAFAPDPADLVSGTDLDLTGDGAVDRADLHEAESPFDFDVDTSHHGHDGGVIDA